MSSQSKNFYGSFRRWWQARLVKRWKRMEMVGKARHALDMGAIGALFYAVFLSVSFWIIDNGFTLHGSLPEHLIKLVTMQTIFGFLFGFAGGWLRWEGAIRRYHEYLATQPAPNLEQKSVRQIRAAGYGARAADTILVYDEAQRETDTAKLK